MTPLPYQYKFKTRYSSSPKNTPQKIRGYAMSDHALLLKNASLLNQRLPILSKIELLSCSNYKILSNRKGEVNLCKEEDGKLSYYHSTYNAEKEAMKWANSLEIHHTEILYIFGIGLGYYYNAIVPWLKKQKNRYLIFLENDLCVLKNLIKTKNATKLLEDSQVIIHYLDSSKNIQKSLRDLCWTFVSRPKTVSALLHYRQKYSKDFANIHLNIMLESAVNDTTAKELECHGKAFFQNFYDNLQILKDSLHGNLLFKQFKRLPAIICGAGPSLKNNASLLGDMKNKSVIFAGGTALNALNKYQISPHFGAGNDPHEFQYERIDQSTSYPLPFFYQNRFHHQSLSHLHGPKLYISSPGYYSIIEWINRELRIKSDKLTDGYNVVHFCIEIAKALGCNPIVFVGMDLAYTGQREHAEGINKSDEEKKLTDFNKNNPNVILHQDIYDRPIYTHWKWLNEAKWISSYAKKHPKTSFVNATEGGIGFPGIKNTPLQELSHSFLSKNYDIENRIHTSLQTASLPNISDKNLMDAIEKIAKSLCNCIKSYEKELERLLHKEKMALNKSSLENYFYDLLHKPLEKELAYKNILEPIGAAREQHFNLLLHQIEFNNTQQSTKEKNIQYLKSYKTLLNFYKDAATKNLKILQKHLSSIKPR